MKNTVSDSDKLADKLEEDDKSTIEESVKETLDWLAGSYTRSLFSSTWALSKTQIHPTHPQHPLNTGYTTPKRTPSSQKKRSSWAEKWTGVSPSWSDDNQNAEKEEYEEKLKEIEGRGLHSFTI
jgi:hypothetical protein